MQFKVAKLFFSRAVTIPLKGVFFLNFTSFPHFLDLGIGKSKHDKASPNG